MRVARPVVLSTEQRDLLESRARARSASARRQGRSIPNESRTGHRRSAISRVG